MELMNYLMILKRKFLDLRKVILIKKTDRENKYNVEQKLKITR